MSNVNFITISNSTISSKLKLRTDSNTESIANYGAPGTTSSNSFTLFNFPENVKAEHRSLLFIGRCNERTVEAIDFFIFLCAIVFLCSGFGLLGITTWILITTLYYTILTQTTTFVISNVLTFCSGFISIPCFWILCYLNNKKNYLYFPILLVSITVGLILLSISITIGYYTKSNIAFDYSNKTYKLIKNSAANRLNKTVFNSMKDYNEIQIIWDTIQKKHKCCGTDGPSRWITLNQNIPKSCCSTTYCTDNWYNKEGCLDAIVFELIWKESLILGLSCIDLGLKACMLCILSYSYIRTLYLDTVVEST